MGGIVIASLIERGKDDLTDELIDGIVLDFLRDEGRSISVDDARRHVRNRLQYEFEKWIYRGDHTLTQEEIVASLARFRRELDDEVDKLINAGIRR